jgi:hypothetical protein
MNRNFISIDLPASPAREALVGEVAVAALAMRKPEGAEP